MRNISAVIGLGYGDEGKGKVVDYLCSKSPNPLVIRYSGGQQAGHHVITEDGKEHVFSNFGSGTLRGVPTYWSGYCTVDIDGILNEAKKLSESGIFPLLYVDPKCPITTQFEKIYNLKMDKKLKHGTVGVGVGATWEREVNRYSLLVGDLSYPSVFKIKLAQIYKYYREKGISLSIGEMLSRWKMGLDTGMVYIGSMPYDFDSYIFEGSQGLLLDQDFGFFPNVTRSNVGMKNILKLIDPVVDKVNVYYVTRAYHTRHGNGPLINEDESIKIRNNPYEQNFDDGHQGIFRKSMLDLDLIKYALEKDKVGFGLTNLVITCIDLLDEYKFTYKGKCFTCSKEDEFLKDVFEITELDFFYVSRSPISTELERVY